MRPSITNLLAVMWTAPPSFLLLGWFARVHSKGWAADGRDLATVAAYAIGIAIGVAVLAYQAGRSRPLQGHPQ